MEMNNTNKTPAGDLDSDFIQFCLDNNEFGDSELSKRLHRNEFVFNKTLKKWMQWTGHHWAIYEGMENEGLVSGVLAVYQEERKRLAQTITKIAGEGAYTGYLANRLKRTNKRIYDLQIESRQKRCLEFAHTSLNPLAISGDEVDKKPCFLACSNGVIDLATGTLKPGKRADYLMKASPVEFPETGIETDVFLWEHFLLGLFNGDQGIVNLFRRVCGAALRGESWQPFIVAMSGENRNTLYIVVKILSDVLGTLAGCMRTDKDLKQLPGLKFAFMFEGAGSCGFSSSRFKLLAESNGLPVRLDHGKQEFLFQPVHTLFLVSDFKSKKIDRLTSQYQPVIIPFEKKSILSPEPSLIKKIYPVILAWLVRGAVEWQESGCVLQEDQ